MHSPYKYDLPAAADEAGMQARSIPNWISWGTFSGCCRMPRERGGGLMTEQPHPGGKK